MAAVWVDDAAAFLSHIGPRPSDDHSLDRIDVDGDCAPGNVRWATREQQANNKTSTIKIAIDDKLWTLSEAALLLGIKRETLYMREFRASRRNLARQP